MEGVASRAMAFRGMGTRILGVVVGAATVESLSMTARITASSSSSSSFFRIMSSSSSVRGAAASSRSSSTARMMVVGSPGVDAGQYTDFIKEKVQLASIQCSTAYLYEYISRTGIAVLSCCTCFFIVVKEYY